MKRELLPMEGCKWPLEVFLHANGTVKVTNGRGNLTD